jgi:hypothetical protein
MAALGLAGLLDGAETNDKELVAVLKRDSVLSVLSRFAPQQFEHFLVRSLGKSFIIAANRVEVRVHQEDSV